MDIFVRGLNALLMICLPLALGALLAKRWILSWGLFGIGAATFVASQVLHLPFNSLVLNRALVALGWSNPASLEKLAGGAILAGLSAGFFEEGARYLTYRFWAKEARSWGEGLMLGAGHGGIEAVLLGLLAGYALFQALALRGSNLAAMVPADQLQLAQTQLQAYWELPWYGALLGAVERLFAICLHLSLSVMVLQCFARRQHGWLALAIGWHAVVDTVAVAASLRLGVYWAEALVGLMALASVGIVLALREKAAALQPAPASPVPPVRWGQMDVPVTTEQLDDSRFT